MVDMMKKGPKRFNNPFIALKHKNFRYYWFGMCVSLVGTWMQNIAQPWLAYSLTKSAFKLSLVGAMQFVPVMLFSIFAGVVIDQYPKKKILFFTQSASLGITFILALLIWLGKVRYWHLLTAATVLGLVNTLDMPTRQSFVIELVGKADLMNAIALNSSVFNLARILGPALAGVVMAYAGVTACFFANSLSFAAVIVGLCFVKPLPVEGKPRHSKNVWREIADGWQHIYQNETLLKTLLAVGIVATFAMNFNVLVPVMAKVVLKQQGTGFGFLMSFLGMGSFLGAMLIAMLSKSGPQKLILQGLPVLIAFFLVVTGFTNTYYLTGLGLALAGLCFVSFSSTANSTMQLNTGDEYRGRVMSIYTLVFGGTTPIGNLYAGLITDRFGPQVGFMACGGIVVLLWAGLVVWVRQGKRWQRRNR